MYTLHMECNAWYVGTRGQYGVSEYRNYHRIQDTIRDGVSPTVWYDNGAAIAKGSFGFVYNVTTPGQSLERVHTVTKVVLAYVEDCQLSPHVFEMPDDVYFTLAFRRNAPVMVDASVDLGGAVATREGDAVVSTPVRFTWHHTGVDRQITLTYHNAPPGFEVDATHILLFTIYMDKAVCDAHRFMHNFDAAFGIIPPSLCLKVLRHVCNQLKFAYNFGERSGEPFIYVDMKLKNVLYIDSQFKMGDFGGFSRRGDFEYKDTYPLPFRLHPSGQTLEPRNPDSMPIHVYDVYGVWNLYVLYMEMMYPTIMAADTGRDDRPRHFMNRLSAILVDDPTIATIFTEFSPMLGHNDAMELFLRNLERGNNPAHSASLPHDSLFLPLGDDTATSSNMALV